MRAFCMLSSFRPGSVPASSLLSRAIRNVLPRSVHKFVRNFDVQYRARTPNGVMKIDSRRVPQYIGHCTSRNMMRTNEDRYVLGFVSLPIRNAPQQVFTASVFDGHGGPQCADFLQQQLATIVENVDIPDLEQSVLEKYKSKFGGYWRSARILNAATIKSYEESNYDDLSVRLPLAFLSADLQELEMDQMTGSTATCVYIYTLDPQQQFWERGAHSNLVVAQVGDTRALIADNEGNVTPLTTVHHADSPLESDRLARYSQAFNFTSDGIERFLQYVNTRAFGDFQGKAMGVWAMPELTEYAIGSGHERRLPGKDAFIVLVTDGVTDVASDQEISDIVIQRAMKGGSYRGTPQDAASEILSYVAMLGTHDNATAIVIRLGAWGDWDNWQDRTGKMREERLVWSSQRRET